MTSPSPWLCGADLPPERLLGPDGGALLRQLDQQPAPLLAWLAFARGNKLGKYAERLFSFWFRWSPHIRIAAENLNVINSTRRTLGEFDFLLWLDGEPWHLETTSKFYLQLDDDPASLIGPSLRDAWRLKATKLATQLQLSRHPAAAALLPDGFADCRIGARLTGWFFYAAGRPLPPLLARGQLRGWYAPLEQDWPQAQPGSRWAWLPRLSWLAPALLDEGDIQQQAALRARLQASQAPQLVAELQPAAGGLWQEVARGFVTPDGWPDPARLAELQSNLPQP
ncbi:hypothetical protein BI347_05450 [Chromobacterium sphagni]|uniref:DUF1853 domain-containing protein n=1 Tax=Chromobacterium sphagni TaxID=1903179 RepID=A0A1S1X6U1_9NEIS|nr:hypothetical protein BI347_05450 [Chromobacterium sphagni]OHX19395.1 hypothetical protein BI344_09190 [Chromobacterium sphagni]